MSGSVTDQPAGFTEILHHGGKHAGRGSLAMGSGYGNQLIILQKLAQEFMITGAYTCFVLTGSDDFREVFQESIADNDVHVVFDIGRIKWINRNVSFDQSLFGKEMLFQIRTGNLIAKI